MVATLTQAKLDPSLRWIDVLGALLGGIGFTGSLLIKELAFAGDALRARVLMSVPKLVHVRRSRASCALRLGRVQW